LAGIVFAVMIPVAIRYAWRSELKEAAIEDGDTIEEGVEQTVQESEGGIVQQVDSNSKPSKSKNKLVYIVEEEEEVEDDRSFIGNASIRSIESFSSMGGMSYNEDIDGSGDEQEPFIHNKKHKSKSGSLSVGKSSRNGRGHEKRKSLKEVFAGLGSSGGGGGGAVGNGGKRRKASISLGNNNKSECERMVLDIRGDGGNVGKERMANEDRRNGRVEIVV
jgi:hypothetical protein